MVEFIFALIATGLTTLIFAFALWVTGKIMDAFDYIMDDFDYYMAIRKNRRKGAKKCRRTFLK